MARTNYDEYAFLAWKKNSSYGYTVTTQLYGRWLIQGWKPAQSPGCKTEYGWGVPGTDGLGLHFCGQRGVAEGCRQPRAAPALRIRLASRLPPERPASVAPSWRHAASPWSPPTGPHLGVASWWGGSKVGWAKGQRKATPTVFLFTLIFNRRGGGPKPGRERPP